MEAKFDWLLQQEPWVEYRTRLDLMKQDQAHPQVQQAYQAMLAHPLIQGILSDLTQWPGKVLRRHNDATLLLHKMAFAAETGIKAEEAEVQTLMQAVLRQASEEGPFTVLVNMPTHFGGSGRDERLWLLCDTPLLSYALVKWGLGTHPLVKRSIDHLVSRQRPNGWPCGACAELGPKFKGPGRRDEPCPYANLLMLRLLSVTGTHEKEAQIGTETLLALWEQRRSQKPFLFAMGTHFGKLKAPLIWYDLLHVTEVLSCFDWVWEDERFGEMVQQLKNQAEPDGTFKASSVWRAWKDWDFGQKRAASGWISFLVYRLLSRNHLLTTKS
jgi:hypothetical protein